MEILKIYDNFSQVELKFTEFINLAENTAKNIRNGLSRFNTIRKADIVTDWELFVNITESAKDDIFTFLPIIEDIELNNSSDLIKPLAKLRDRLYDYTDWITDFQNDYYDITTIRHEEANKLLIAYNNMARATINNIEKEFLPALKKHIGNIIELKRTKYEKTKHLQKAVTALTSEINLFNKISPIVRKIDQDNNEIYLFINKTVTLSTSLVEDRKLLTDEITKYAVIATDLIPKIQLLENDIKAYQTMLTVLEIDINDIINNDNNSQYFDILVMDLLKKLREYNTNANKLIKMHDIILRLYTNFKENINQSIDEKYMFVLVNGINEQLLLDYDKNVSKDGNLNITSNIIIRQKLQKNIRIIAKITVNSLIDLQIKQSLKTNVLIHEIEVDSLDDSNYLNQNSIKDELSNIDWKIDIRQRR